jgi:hypothetical protein
MGAVRKLCVLAIAACSVALAQESATVRGPEVVKAGEVVDLEISVDRAPNFDGGAVQVWWPACRAHVSCRAEKKFATSDSGFR